MKIESIEVVEDRTAESRCDAGFLRLARLVLRNHYQDGSHSEPYPCDVVSRKGVDAVVAVLYEISPRGQVRVLLRESPRAPIYLRRFKSFELPDPRIYTGIREVVAGIIEPDDGARPEPLRHRAILEIREEAGLEADPRSLAQIGGESFSSPGTTDEKIYFTAARVALASAGGPTGDGSVMEECCELVILELGEALEACRTGAIPDMKTEVALQRLAEHIGYLPQLACFAHDLPSKLRARYQRLGVAPAPGEAP